jgi:hypothetical protein
MAMMPPNGEIKSQNDLQQKLSYTYIHCWQCMTYKLPATVTNNTNTKNYKGQ